MSENTENTENTENIIEMKHITKVFEDGFTAVSDFNLEVKRGEFVTFLGPSGCGKTTILRMIAGFETPTEGQILLNGQEITELPPNRRPVNTVFQRYALFPNMNIYDNIAFGLKRKKLPKEEIDTRVRRVLKLVDLEGFEGRRVPTLSGGQQQRIAIARALVNRPEILLLDEPLGALDLKMRKEMQIELKAMHDQLGITFIYVTHDQEEALTMSDKIVVISAGVIQQTGTPEDIYNEPKNAFVADFIGESNLFNGIMTGPRKARFCGAEFDCVDDVEPGTRITAVVRPEDVVLSAPEDGTIQGTVTSVIFKGIHYEIVVESGANEMVIQSVRRAKVGDQVGMSVDPDNIHIMIAADNTNYFPVIVSSKYHLKFREKTLTAEIAGILPGVEKTADGSLAWSEGELSELAGTAFLAAIRPEEIEMTDVAEDGLVTGHISDLIYKGDHYSYVIHTKDGEDFFVDSPDLWNMNDYIGLIMPVEKMTFTLKR